MNNIDLIQVKLHLIKIKIVKKSVIVIIFYSDCIICNISNSALMNLLN